MKVNRKYWAAIDEKNNVIALMPMNVRNNINFDEYRQQCHSSLSILGKVKGGTLIQKDNNYLFIIPANHSNRSKTKRPDKEFTVFL